MLAGISAPPKETKCKWYFNTDDHMAWVINGIVYILAFPQISSSQLCVDPVQSNQLLSQAIEIRHFYCQPF